MSHVQSLSVTKVTMTPWHRRAKLNNKYINLMLYNVMSDCEGLEEGGDHLVVTTEPKLNQSHTKKNFLNCFCIFYYTFKPR